MKIAVVGTGVSGMLAGRLLAGVHDVTLFESEERVGGHVHTHAVRDGARTVPVDTGFIVCNDRTYPHFMRLLSILSIETQASRMSFSVACRRTGLEYNGTSLNALFAQRSNLLRPSFHRMVRDILRFHRDAPRVLAAGDSTLTLGDLLQSGRYGPEFAEHYILPMGGAVWSAEPAMMRDFPAITFLRFFQNHGMLSVDDRPVWRVVKGGSRVYADALIAPLRDRIRTGCPVVSIRRTADGVDITTLGATPERFDQVVIAAHSDQALAMLADPSEEERVVLGAIPYQENVAVLHTDTRVMPRRKLAWAAWNYHLGTDGGGVAVTYWMNELQTLAGPTQWFVTLNDVAGIDPDKVLRRITYQHPVYRREGIAAQARWSEINGVRRTWYCGAYWAYGFHEDGVRSALRVAERFGRSLDDLEREAGAAGRPRAGRPEPATP
ncbi:MAG: FAD-dependent oxidoreductase [Planctomycetes bacterium]|nr:FAD-dependent oxidoreductase [Planctomycetota bacterium]